MAKLKAEEEKRQKLLQRDQDRALEQKRLEITKAAQAALAQQLQDNEAAAAIKESLLERERAEIEQRARLDLERLRAREEEQEEGAVIDMDADRAEEPDDLNWDGDGDESRRRFDEVAAQVDRQLRFSEQDHEEALARLGDISMVSQSDRRVISSFLLGDYGKTLAC